MCWGSIFSKKAQFLKAISNEDWVNGITFGQQSITDTPKYSFHGHFAHNLKHSSSIFPDTQLGSLTTRSWQESPLQAGHNPQSLW